MALTYSVSGTDDAPLMEFMIPRQWSRRCPIVYHIVPYACHRNKEMRQTTHIDGNQDMTQVDGGLGVG